MNKAYGLNIRILVNFFQGDNAMNLMNVLGDPKTTAAIQAAEQMKKLIQRDSSSHIEKHEKTSGFEFLDVFANAQSTKGIPQEHIKKLVDRQLNPFAGDNPEIKRVVEEMKQNLECFAEEHQEQVFTIISKKGEGITEAIFLYFKIREDRKYDFKKLLFRGQFGLAADLVITRRSKKDFWGSSSKDVINYLPRRGLTEQDVKDLLNMIVPKIAQVMNEFVPPQ